MDISYLRVYHTRILPGLLVGLLSYFRIILTFVILLSTRKIIMHAIIDIISVNIDMQNKHIDISSFLWYAVFI